MKIPLLTDLSVTANRWWNRLKYTSIIMTGPLERISAISQRGLEVSAPPSGSSLALTDQTLAEAGNRDQFSLRAKGLHSEGPKLPWLGLCRPVSQINHHQAGPGHQAAIWAQQHLHRGHPGSSRTTHRQDSRAWGYPPVDMATWNRRARHSAIFSPADMSETLWVN